jgi:hypothetical protein
MLEVFLYHDYAAEALGDSIVDLVDFCMRKVSYMIRLYVSRPVSFATCTAPLLAAQVCERRSVR